LRHVEPALYDFHGDLPERQGGFDFGRIDLLRSLHTDRHFHLRLVAIEAERTDEGER
jgi:hypothetical protein